MSRTNVWKCKQCIGSACYVSCSTSDFAPERCPWDGDKASFLRQRIGPSKKRKRK